MTPLARSALNHAMQIVMQQNGGHDPRQVFNVTPTIAQSIETRIQQSNDFLNSINVTAVRDISGEVLHFGGAGMITKRTNTIQPDGSLRRHSQPAHLIARDYHCKDIEQDTLIKWDLIDSWAHLPNFYEKLRTYIMGLQARDNLRVMWHGQFAAADTDETNYPMGEDIQRGFFQYLIEKYPENVLGISPDATAPGGYTVDTIRVGPGAGANGFESMDDLSFYMRDAMVDKLYRKDKKLKIIVGDKLSFAEKGRLIGSGASAPTEKIASKLLLQSSQYGELERKDSDEFPDHGVFIADPSNLSHYWQRNSVRSEYNQTSHAKKGVMSHYYKRSDNVIEIVEATAAAHPDAIHIPTGYDNAGNATGWAPAGDTWKAN